MSQHFSKVTLKYSCFLGWGAHRGALKHHHFPSAFDWCLIIINLLKTCWKAFLFLYDVLAVFGLSSFICYHRSPTSPLLRASFPVKAEGSEWGWKMVWWTAAFSWPSSCAQCRGSSSGKCGGKKEKRVRLRNGSKDISFRNTVTYLKVSRLQTSPFDVRVRIKQIGAWIFCRDIMDERHVSLNCVKCMDNAFVLFKPRPFKVFEHFVFSVVKWMCQTSQLISTGFRTYNGFQ